MCIRANALRVVRWNYFYTNAISVPVEITAAGLILTFWSANVRLVYLCIHLPAHIPDA